MIDLGKKRKLNLPEIRIIWLTEENHLSPWIASNIFPLEFNLIFF